MRDIVIIGGGVFGLATACYLGRLGLGARVRLLERGTLAGGATSRAAALLTLVRDKPGYLPLVRETYAAIGTLQREFGADVGLHACGALHVAQDRGVTALDALAEMARRDGLAVEALDPAQASRLAPWLDSASCARRWFFPEEAYCDPYLFASAYAHGARALGVQLDTGIAVERIHVVDGAVSGVVLADGRCLPADQVVLAAGAWSSVLAAAEGVGLPMAPVRSQYWITGASPAIARDGAIVLMPEARAYARPEAGRLLFGVRETEAAVLDPRGLPEDPSRLTFRAEDPEGWGDLVASRDALLRLFPRLEQTGIAHHVDGPSCYTVDGRLLLGPVDAPSGLHVACGCNGAGIACSGGVGRLLAEGVAGMERPVALRVFLPGPRLVADPFAPALLARCGAVRAVKTSG